MGIPAAFRWLSTKYPKIISPVIEDLPETLEDGTIIPVDTTRPNPNGEEFDNLYLDMNGIVHPCSHPEDRPPPKDEEEMMVEVFKYTDRVVNMVRPRKLLMIAVDGVAPRAKMNQQRSRRFRAAQEAKEKAEDKEKLITLLKQQNGGTHPAESTEDVVKKVFDSNSITPGTPFMEILAASLRYWCSYKLNTDPAWAKVKVIISDATVPGEGEHKIMNFVRSQRSSPEHDPNTRHVIYGLDADLIMLGLATHEPHFRVLREDVFAQQGQARMCKICGQKGHDAQNCRGEAKDEKTDFEGKDNAYPLKPFIWLHVSIFREYLAVELNVPDLPFQWDIERAIDDWVFMCFFVGNDFLPHLPALEIRENSIDTLVAIWKDNMPHMGGFLTKDGHCDLGRVQLIMEGVARQEDAIFRRRKETEDKREAGFKRRKMQEERRNGGNNRNHNQAGAGGNRQKVKLDNMVPALAPEAMFMPITSLPGPLDGPRKSITHDMVVNRSAVQDANNANKSAASVLKSQIQGLMAKPSEEAANGKEAEQTAPSGATKRKAEVIDTSTNSPTAASDDEGPVDTVKLWEEGYADRYYEQKFKVDPKDIEFRHKVARHYVEGLAWVLMYYFQGCPSWDWYYPFHYAPFAADFVGLDKMEISFNKGRISKPYEQLMSVLPAASRHSIPPLFHDLMLNDDSTIIDFYPEDFEVDLNGKKMAWQGVALLPFIDMPRLLLAMEKKYPDMTSEEAARNEVGNDVLIISDGHTEFYDDIITHFYSKKQGAPRYTLDPKASEGLTGEVAKIDDYLPHGALTYPHMLERKEMPDLDYDRSLSVHYEMPGSAHTHKSMLLRGVKLPTPALDRNDIEDIRNKGRRSGRGHGGVPFTGGRGGGGGYRGGRNNEPMSYAPGGGYQGGNGGGYQGRGGGRGGYNGGGRDNRYDGPPPRNGGAYNGGGGGGGYNAPPPSWIPPPPGAAGFGAGAPPPPPPGNYGGGGGWGQQQPQSYVGGYNGPPPPGQYYGGGGGGYQGGGGGQGYSLPPPPGRDDHRYDGGRGGYGGGRNGGSRGYNGGGGGGGYRR